MLFNGSFQARWEEEIKERDWKLKDGRGETRQNKKAEKIKG